MLTVLLGQWLFSQAHIIAWHSLTLNVLILSGFLVGVDCWLCYTEALHQHLNHWSFVQEESRHVVIRKHAEHWCQGCVNEQTKIFLYEGWLRQKHLPTEETQIIDLYTLRGAGKHEDESDSVIQPLLQHKHPDSRDEKHKADTQTATAGADRKTSVPRELELAVIAVEVSGVCAAPGVSTSAPSAASCSTCPGITASPYSATTTHSATTVRLTSWGGPRTAVDRPPRGPSGRSKGCRRSRAAKTFTRPSLSVLALNVKVVPCYAAWSGRHTHTNAWTETDATTLPPPAALSGDASSTWLFLL